MARPSLLFEFQLEAELRFELDEAGRCVAAEEGAEDGGWGVDGGVDGAF